MKKLALLLTLAALSLSCKAEARDAALWWTAVGDDGTVGRARVGHSFGGQWCGPRRLG